MNNEKNTINEAMKIAAIIAMAPTGFDWNETRDPDTGSGNYFNGFVSAKLSNEDGFGANLCKLLYETWHKDEVRKTRDVLREAERIVREITNDDTPFTRREALLVFTGVKIIEYALHDMEHVMRSRAVVDNPLAALLAAMGDK